MALRRNAEMVWQRCERVSQSFCCVTHGAHNRFAALHKGLARESILTPQGEFALVDVGEDGVEEGMRTYEWFAE